jgi:hypothetical protein
MIALIMALGLFAVGSSAIATPRALERAMADRTEALVELNDAFYDSAAAIALQIVEGSTAFSTGLGNDIALTAVPAADAYVGNTSQRTAAATAIAEAVAAKEAALGTGTVFDFSSNVALQEWIDILEEIVKSDSLPVDPADLDWGTSLANVVNSVYAQKTSIINARNTAITNAVNAGIIPAIRGAAAAIARTHAVNLRVSEASLADRNRAADAQNAALTAATGAATANMAISIINGYITGTASNWADFTAAMNAVNNAVEAALGGGGTDTPDPQPEPDHWTDNLPSWLSWIGNLPGFLQTVIYIVGFFWLWDILFW